MIKDKRNYKGKDGFTQKILSNFIKRLMVIIFRGVDTEALMRKTRKLARHCSSWCKAACHNTRAKLNSCHRSGATFLLVTS